MDGPSDKIGSLLVVLLKSQIGVQKALEKLVTVRPQRAHIGCSRANDEGRSRSDGNGRGKERSQDGPGDGL
jgi:hypothetical protein